MSVRTYKLLGYLQLFVGMGGIAGGLPMILTPDGAAQGLSTEMLSNTPFADFLIPGLFLLAVNGIGSLIASYFSLKMMKEAGMLGIIFGVLLMAWIVIQVIMLGFVSWLQPLYLALGTLELFWGLRIVKLNRLN